MQGMVRCEPVDGMGMDWLDNFGPAKPSSKDAFRGFQTPRLSLLPPLPP